MARHYDGPYWVRGEPGEQFRYCDPRRRSTGQDTWLVAQTRGRGWYWDQPRGRHLAVADGVSTTSDVAAQLAAGTGDQDLAARFWVLAADHLTEHATAAVHAADAVRIQRGSLAAMSPAERDALHTAQERLDDWRDASHRAAAIARYGSDDARAAAQLAARARPSRSPAEIAQERETRTAAFAAQGPVAVVGPDPWRAPAADPADVMHPTGLRARLAEELDQARAQLESGDVSAHERGEWAEHIENLEEQLGIGPGEDPPTDDSADHPPGDPPRGQTSGAGPLTGEHLALPGAIVHPPSCVQDCAWPGEEFDRATNHRDDPVFWGTIAAELLDQLDHTRARLDPGGVPPGREHDLAERIEQLQEQAGPAGAAAAGACGDEVLAALLADLDATAPDPYPGEDTPVVRDTRTTAERETDAWFVQRVNEHLRSCENLEHDSAQATAEDSEEPAPTRLHGADAQAWGVAEGTRRSALPTTYEEWVAEGREGAASPVTAEGIAPQRAEIRGPDDDPDPADEAQFPEHDPQDHAIHHAADGDTSRQRADAFLGNELAFWSGRTLDPDPLTAEHARSIANALADHQRLRPRHYDDTYLSGERDPITGEIAESCADPIERARRAIENLDASRAQHAPAQQPQPQQLSNSLADQDTRTTGFGTEDPGPREPGW